MYQLWVLLGTWYIWKSFKTRQEACAEELDLISQGIDETAIKFV